MFEVAGEDAVGYPDASLFVEGLANKTGVGLNQAGEELGDNAFDADAKHVVYEFNRKFRWFRVTDDGHGTDKPWLIFLPYNREGRAATRSGRFGIGASTAIPYLNEGRGFAWVMSVCGGTSHVAKIDYNVVRKTGEFRYRKELAPAPTGATPGTVIKVDNCREFTNRQIDRFKAQLAFDFMPALNRGARITVVVDGVAGDVVPYKPPRFYRRKPFDFEIDGRRVHGFCGLLARGESSRIKGFAVAYAHRVVGTFNEPFGDRDINTSRIHAEVYLEDGVGDNKWKVNDHKIGFSGTQDALWDRLGFECSDIFDMAASESARFDLDAAAAAAQVILDLGTGAAARMVKEKREKPRPLNEGDHGRGDGKKKRRNLKNVQPGDSVPAPGGDTRGGDGKEFRIIPQFVRDLHNELGKKVDYDVQPGSRTTRVLIDADTPQNLKYQDEAHAEYLADVCMLAVLKDARARPASHTALLNVFQADEAFSIAEMFTEFRKRVRRAAGVPADTQTDRAAPTA